MKYLTLTLLTLFSHSLFASEVVQIDMHGGKDKKNSSKFTQKTPNMKDKLKLSDNNTSQ
jgi:hypothetical protein